MRYKYGQNPFKVHSGTFWSARPNAYKVTHADGEFILTSPDRIDYRETVKILKEQGYKRPYITYIGRDVAM